VLLDPARHFLPVGTIKLVLDAMAALKLNALHLHLTGGSCSRALLQ
jgi:hexosaminidase